MALNAYLTLTGESQGKVIGSCTQSGREDMMEIYGFSHEVLSPRDAASGTPTGKRQHKPIVITKAIDKATPLLMRMLATNENIPSWKIDFYRPSKKGAEEQYYSIELKNASIESIRPEQLNNKYPENMPHELREHVAFVYQKIVWTWNDGGIQAEDDWEAPRS